MKIGILGTRGIPNQYGGFEQFAEYVSVALVARGHEVWVYNSSLHPYKDKTFNGVHLVHCYDPEDKMGTAGQFIYDLNCILDSRKRGFDVLLQLGYTSSAVWWWLLPKSSQIITNMDGLEWKRSKYSKKVQRFLRWSEKKAARTSDHLVADARGIQTYLKEKYQKEATFIAYGAEALDNTPSSDALGAYNVVPNSYYMLMARMEPENNIAPVLEALRNTETPILIVGNPSNAYGQELKQKYSAPQYRWLGAIYDMNILNALRHHCKAYFHGHSVGGTNPSLLEAMASHTFIIAHDNPFNRGVLGKDALYFNSWQDLQRLLREGWDSSEAQKMAASNWQKIKAEYTWEQIVTRYEKLFLAHAQSGTSATQ